MLYITGELSENEIEKILENQELAYEKAKEIDLNHYLFGGNQILFVEDRRAQKQYWMEKE